MKFLGRFSTPVRCRDFVDEQTHGLRFFNYREKFSIIVRGREDSCIELLAVSMLLDHLDFELNYR